MASTLYGVLADLKYKDIQGFLLEKEYAHKFLWKQFFPTKATPFLTYQTIIGSKGNPVAADVISYDASAPEKTRRKVDSLTGTIPKIAMKKTMSEMDLLKYHTFKVQAGGDAALDAMVDIVFNDIDAVARGAQARLEWLVLQALCSSTISLTKSNNNGVVTEATISFQMPADNKRVIKSGTATRKWATGTAAQIFPVTDFEAIVVAARDNNIAKPKWALMNWTAYQYFVGSDQVQDLSASFSGQGQVFNSDFIVQPETAQVNAMLRARGLPQVIVIDELIDIEDVDHTQTATDPWTTKYVSFLPDVPVGEMLLAPIAEEIVKPKNVTQFKQDDILISQWATVDPVSSAIKGEINAFPSWENVDFCLRLDTAKNETDGLDD